MFALLLPLTKLTEMAFKNCSSAQSKGHFTGVFTLCQMCSSTRRRKFGWRRKRCDWNRSRLARWRSWRRKM